MTVWLPFSPVWQGINNLWLDPVVRWRAAAQPGDPDIAVVAIDEYSIRAMQPVAGSWPWPRSVTGELVEALKVAGAEAVILDVMFYEADRYRPDHDVYFGEILDQHDDVYVPLSLMRTDQPQLSPKAVEYPESLQLEPTDRAEADARLELRVPAVGDPEHWQGGLINFIPDADGTSRRYPLYLEQHGWRIPSLPARVVRDQTGSLPEAGEIRLDWRHAESPPYRTHSFADLYEHLLQGQPLDPDAFGGRWVLIGATATGLHDLRATPVNPHFPGVYILATALDNLKNGHALERIEPVFESVAALIIVLVLLLAWYRGWALVPVLGVLIVFSAITLLASALLGLRGLLVPVLPLLLLAWLAFLVIAVLNYWREYQARKRAIDLFGRFLDPTVVSELAERGLVEDSLMAREVEISVLFSDVRGFTTLSEQRSADEIMSLLNDYFARQVDVIFRHEGTLDKFIGDAVMAFWGAPIAAPDHAGKAVAAALEMRQVLADFKQDLGIPDFDIGIGIHTGPAVVGMLGSQQRYDYTAIGDTVNLASRIEGLTRDRAGVLVSEATRDACRVSFDFKSHGHYNVKGRLAEVAVFEPHRKLS